MGFWDSLGGAFTGDNVPTNYQDANYIRNTAQQGIAGAQGQQAPQLASGPQDQVRAAQMAQIAQLQRIASGQQLGAGELAVNRQVNQAQAAQEAMARMARGNNAALAARNAANQTASIGLGGAGQAQQAALSDQQTAQGLLTGATNNARGQDLSLAGQNAQLAQNQYGINTNAQLGYLGTLGGMDANQLQAGQNAAQNQNKFWQGLIGAGANGAATALVASDENLKEGISEAADDIDEMLDGIRAFNYKYKEPEKYGVGERAGIMAQDLERSKAGKAVVMNTPVGKMLDVGKTVSASLAGLARLNERVRALEGV